MNFLFTTKAEDADIKLIDFGLSDFIRPAHPWLLNECCPIPLDILIYKLVKSYLHATPFKRVALKLFNYHLEHGCFQFLTKPAALIGMFFPGVLDWNFLIEPLIDKMFLEPSNATMVRFLSYISDYLAEVADVVLHRVQWHMKGQKGIASIGRGEGHAMSLSAFLCFDQQVQSWSLLSLECCVFCYVPYCSVCFEECIEVGYREDLFFKTVLCRSRSKVLQFSTLIWVVMNYTLGLERNVLYA